MSVCIACINSILVDILNRKLMIGGSTNETELVIAGKIKNILISENGSALIKKKIIIEEGISTLLESSDTQVLKLALQCVEIILSNKKLNDLISNKKLVEEKCNSLKLRLSKGKSNNVELYNLLVKLSDLFYKCERDALKKPDISAASYNKRFMNKVNRRAKQTMLQIGGIDDEITYKKINQILVKQNGIISYTWTVPKKRVLLRTGPRFRLEHLAYNIASDLSIYDINKICRNITKEEVLVPVDIPTTEIVDVGSHGYLPDDFELSERTEQDDDGGFVEGELPLATGNEPDLNGSYSNWLSGVGNFISKKLFW